MSDHQGDSSRNKKYLGFVIETMSIGLNDLKKQRSLRGNLGNDRIRRQTNTSQGIGWSSSHCDCERAYGCIDGKSRLPSSRCGRPQERMGNRRDHELGNTDWVESLPQQLFPFRQHAHKIVSYRDLDIFHHRTT